MPPPPPILAMACSLCLANRMRSLAWRPRLGPAVHYWVRQGNGRLFLSELAFRDAKYDTH